MTGGMSDALLQAIVVGVGALAGSIIGNLFRPLLEHYLRGKAQRAESARAVTRSEFDELYRPLYDLFQNGLPPDEPFEYGVTPEIRDRVVELVNKHRPLAEPTLEHSVLTIEETAWTAGGTVDTAELQKVWNHVRRRYNALKKQLDLPFTPSWHGLSPRRLYWKAWWRWQDFIQKRRRKRLRLRKAAKGKQDA